MTRYPWRHSRLAYAVPGIVRALVFLVVCGGVAIALIGAWNAARRENAEREEYRLWLQTHCKVKEITRFSGVRVECDDGTTRWI